MTAYELLQNSLHLISETPDTAGYTEAQVISIINLLLSETFGTNNTILVFKGEPELTEPQRIESYSDELLYTDDLLVKVIPFGLVSNFFIADDEVSKGQLFNERYVNALNDASKVKFVTVRL